MISLTPDGHMPPMIKYTFSDYGYRSEKREEINPEELNITGLEKSEEGFELVFSRKELSGVMIETSFPQEYVLQAADFLKDLFEKYGQYAFCRLNIYQRHPVNVMEYSLIRSFGLDFQSVKIYDDYIQIESENVDLNTYIKSSGRTKFDIPVLNTTDPDTGIVTPGIAEEKQWAYGRLTLKQRATYNSSIENAELTKPLGHVFYYLFINLLGAEVMPELGFDIRSQNGGSFTTYSDGNYFFKASRTQEINLSFNVNVKMKIERDAPPILRLMKNNDDLRAEEFTLTDENTWEAVMNYERDLTLEEGDRLSLAVQFRQSQFEYNYTLSVEMENLEISFWAQGGSRIIDVVDPEKLLNRLLKMMTNNRNYTGVIEWDEMPYRSMLCAAESVRRFLRPYLHVSFNDFAGWMRCKGYEYSHSGNQIVFKNRNKFFLKNETALELPQREVAGLIIEADPEHAYTAVRIGYEKQDYNKNVNGYFEVNGTYEFTTGYLSQMDNVLDLVSPFRADPIGIELLCWQTPEYGKETTDNQGDNDLFEVAMLIEETYPFFVEYEDEYITVENVKLFNTVLNPVHLVKANKSLLGVITDKLYFKSTTNNRNARIYSTDIASLYEDIPIDEKLFEPIVYNFATGSHMDIPLGDRKNGIVKFRYKNKNYQGFLKDGTRNLTRGTEATVILYAVEK